MRLFQAGVLFLQLHLVAHDVGVDAVHTLDDLDPGGLIRYGVRCLCGPVQQILDVTVHRSSLADVHAELPLVDSASMPSIFSRP